MTKAAGERFKTEMIYVPIRNLSVVWVQSQRVYNENWAKKIADNFDPDKFDPPVITKPNGVGHYHVVEGQHRIQGAKLAFGENEQLCCRMVDAADPARAAEIWLGINSGRKAISPVQRFLVSVTAEREPETEINAMVQKMSYRIGPSKGDHVITAVSTLIDIHNRLGKALLQNVLTTLDRTWPGDAAGFGGELLRGYAAFHNEFRHFDQRRLADVIRKDFSPGRLLIAGRGYSEQHLITVSAGLSETLRSRYNRGLREDQKLKKK